MALILVREGPYSLSKMTRGVIYNESDMSKPLLYTIENPGSGKSNGYYGGVKNKIMMADTDVLGKCIPEEKYSIYDFASIPRFGIDGIRILPKGKVVDNLGLMIHPGNMIIDKRSWVKIQSNHGSKAESVLANYLAKNNLSMNLNYSHSQGCILASISQFKFNEDDVVYTDASYSSTNATLLALYNGLPKSDRNLKITNSIDLLK